jgi:hypothetical protein
MIAGVVCALALAGVGCSADGGGSPAGSSVPPQGFRQCDELYAQGAVVEDDTFGLACVRNDAIVSPRPVRLECSDGRKLLFNDLAWGYEGEPMTTTAEDDPSKMPETEVDACLAQPAGGASSTTSPDDDA